MQRQYSESGERSSAEGSDSPQPNDSSGDAGSSQSRDASQTTGTAEWSGKYQGFLDKRSNSRFAFFGSRWKRRW